MNYATLDHVLDYVFFQTRSSLRTLLEKEVEEKSKAMSTDTLNDIIIDCLSPTMVVLMEEAMKGCDIVEKEDVLQMKQQIGSWVGTRIGLSIKNSIPVENQSDPDQSHVTWADVQSHPEPTPTESEPPLLSRVRAVNWNDVQDPVDLAVWNRSWSNFWLPEKIPLSNDLPTWRLMTRAEQLRTIRVFTGLTLLDTMQYEEGIPSIIDEIQTQLETAVLSAFGAQESIHARSYSSIFSTLCTSQEIEEAYIWSEQCKPLQYKAEILTKKYRGSTPLKRKVASILLEMFLFYSGFFWPLYLSAHGKIPNSGDLIKLIIR